MKIAVFGFLSVVVLVVLSACATLTKEECIASNWYGIGDRDGAQGVHPETQFRYHVATCKWVKILPDYTIWWEGYKNGLLRYCTRPNGLRVGQNGATYYHVCPPELEQEFLYGYYLGEKEHTIRSRINTIRNEIKKLNSEIEKMREEIKIAEVEQVRKLRSEIMEKEYIIRSSENNLSKERDRHSKILKFIQEFKENDDLYYDREKLASF